jgi:hypothetical protein
VEGCWNDTDRENGRTGEKPITFPLSSSAYIVEKRFNSHLSKNTVCFHKQVENNILLFLASFDITALCGQILELLVLRNVVRMFITKL